MKQFYLIVLILFFIIPNAHATECKLTILHFNDLQGQLERPGGKLGGAARLAGLITKIDAENTKDGRRTLVLMGGNLVSGSSDSKRFKGEVEYKFLTAIRAEALAIGNHDLDFGVETFKKNMKSVDFPVLAANVIDKKTERHLGKSTYVYPLSEGCRVGIMGLARADIPNVVQTDVSTLEFHDPIEYASYYIDDLIEQSEVKIALTHIGVKKDLQLVKSVPGFNLVIGGGDQVTASQYCRVASGVPICQTPGKGRYLGRIDLTVRNGKVIVEKTELIPVDSKARKSKIVKKMLKSYLAER